MIDAGTVELVRTLALSCTRDDDIGNALLGVLVEQGEHMGYQVERLVASDVAGAPVLVHAARRHVAGAVLARLDDMEVR